MGSSMSVVNELEFPIHVALCHLGPVHNVQNLKPGVKFTWENIGKVWFTVRVYSGTEDNKRFVNDGAAATAILGAVFSAASFTPFAPIALTASAATVLMNTINMGINSRYGDDPDIVGIVSTIGAAAAIAPAGMTGFAAQIAERWATFAGAHIAVIDVIAAVKNSSGCISEVGGVYADGRTLYIRWNADHTAIDINGS